jgi:hypothetical protein
LDLKVIDLGLGCSVSYLAKDFALALRDQLWQSETWSSTIFFSLL